MDRAAAEQRYRSLVSAAFPTLPLRSVRLLGVGWDSAAITVNDVYVFRFPMRAAVAETLLIERRLLPELAPALPLPVPRFVFQSGPVLDYPWHFVGYPLIPGEPLVDRPDIALTDEQFVAALGPFLTELHRFPGGRATALGVPTYTPNSWLARHRRLFERARQVVSERLPPQPAQRFTSIWEARLSDPSMLEFVPSLIHGDLSLDHILVESDSPGDWRVSGVIDFGDVMVADPALDYAGLPETAARAVASATGAAHAPGFWQRRALYRAAVPLHAIDAGLTIGREDLIDGGLKLLERCLSDG